MVNVYEFLDASGATVGCGTQVEFDYWTGEGVFVGYRLGAVITQEPAAMDAQRRVAWGL